MKNFNLKKIKEIQGKILSGQSVMVADYRYYKEWERSHLEEERKLTEVEQDVHRAEEIEYDLNFPTRDELEWRD